MKGIIIIVHGSRRFEIVKELQKFIETLSLDKFLIQDAYMEFQNPTIDQAIKILINKGCQEIIIFPFFILKGKHINEHIPKIFQKAQQKFPQIKMYLLKHFLQLDGIANMFSKLIKDNTNLIK